MMTACGVAMKRTTVIAVFLLLAAFVSGQARAQEVKIGVVDMAKIIDLSKQGKKATAEITAKLSSAKKDLEKSQDELIKLKEEIESKAMTLPADVLAKKERTYQDKFLEYQRKYEDYQVTLSAKNTELSRTMLTLMKDIIEKIGTEQGYLVILERTKSGILYSSPGIDLTETVIEELNRK
jgi:outer membrane protein